MDQAAQEDSKNRLLILLDPSRTPQHRGGTPCISPNYMLLSVVKHW
jgi:hypothetical protein